MFIYIHILFINVLTDIGGYIQQMNDLLLEIFVNRISSSYETYDCHIIAEILLKVTFRSTCNNSLINRGKIKIYEFEKVHSSKCLDGIDFKRILPIQGFLKSYLESMQITFH